MIPTELYEQVFYETICRGATVIQPDIVAAFERAIRLERSESARRGLQSTLDSMLLSAEKRNPACPDTGWPLFFIRAGGDCRLEGGFPALEAAAIRATRRATKEGFLRATMKHPLTGADPGDNIGSNIPAFEYRFVEGNFLELNYVAKGGGSECFGGTRHRVVAFADGTAGIKKQVVDSFIASARAGAICPPSILGVGVGGTANVAANLAKQAACLRIVGSRNPDPAFAEMEEELTAAINSLGIGVMGAGGETSVFAVHMEYAHTHIAGICVATSSNCMVARRATSRIGADGTVRVLDRPGWFDGKD